MANMPCIHGKVCRAYMETFGLVRKRGEPGADVQMCIISTKCPLCKFYEPAVCYPRDGFCAWAKERGVSDGDGR